MASNFTCLSCSIRFFDGNIQREHYKSDYHRYNLKRKVSDLPPVTQEEFQKRVIQARDLEIEANEDQSMYCKSCQKFFKTKNAHDNHLNSKKHSESLKKFLEYNVNENQEPEDVVVSVKAMEVIEEKRKAKGVSETVDDMDVEEVDSDDWEDDWDESNNPISKNMCIFCDTQSEDLVSNLKHMSKAHSFFIPDAEYCSDVEGLLSYLAEKVARDYICIWCNEKGRTFFSCRSVRRHMNDKGHCKMLHEGAALAEYVDFYDYSASYPDHDDNKDLDAEIEGPQVLDGDDYQLVLPSGLVIGHRSLMRYYKQRLNPNRAVVVKKQDRKMHKILAEYRALGWTSTQYDMAVKRARDIHAMKRIQAKLWEKVGCKANKLQMHYRPQVNF